LNLPQEWQPVEGKEGCLRPDVKSCCDKIRGGAVSLVDPSPKINLS